MRISSNYFGPLEEFSRVNAKVILFEHMCILTWPTTKPSLRNRITENMERTTGTMTPKKVESLPDGETSVM